MEVGVAQPLFGDAVEGGRRNHAAKRARRAEAAIIRHDQQDVGRALRRHHARSPPGFGLRRFLFDLPAKNYRRGRNLFAIDGGSSAGRSQLTRHHLPACGPGKRGDTQQEDDEAAGLQDITAKAHAKYSLWRESRRLTAHPSRDFPRFPVLGTVESIYCIVIVTPPTAADTSAPTRAPLSCKMTPLAFCNCAPPAPPATAPPAPATTSLPARSPGLR